MRDYFLPVMAIILLIFIFLLLMAGITGKQCSEECDKRGGIISQWESRGNIIFFYEQKDVCICYHKDSVEAFEI